MEINQELIFNIDLSLSIGRSNSCSSGKRSHVVQVDDGYKEELETSCEDNDNVLHGFSATNNNNNKKNKCFVATKDDEGIKNGDKRKKLRLTKEQSSCLEDCFKDQSILSNAEKHELAQKLSLRPRQVEVWFQNRRARCKSKQTEEECELLKKCHENLTDENQRLKRELMELMSQLRTRIICSSCEKNIVRGHV